jgi:methylenetetrahydrofolate dehydrogenase (NADP+)/methenyltetrahydrofolate cyclohydrolase
MVAQIIDGNIVANDIRKDIRLKMAELRLDGVTPGLAVIMLGDDPGSASYVKMKGKACTELGMYSQTLRLPSDYSEASLLHLIDELNANKKIHGILVQMPLPKHIDAQKVLVRIDPNKDVDGFHPINVGKLLIGDRSGFLPCTPYGIQILLSRSGHRPDGKHVVIMGRSNIVGKPLAAMLVQKEEGANATVTVCHTGTKDIKKITREADILVAAMGVAEFVKADMVRDGAVVIDVGGVRVPDKSSPKGYRTVGDVDFEAVRERAAAITPVPGGVGPMTIIMLMQNTLLAAQRAQDAE